MIHFAESFFPFGIVFMVVMVLIIVRGTAAAGRRTRDRDRYPRPRHLSGSDQASFGPEIEAGGWRCIVPNCRASNPAHARYCRMCGAKRACR